MGRLSVDGQILIDDYLYDRHMSAEFWSLLTAEERQDLLRQGGRQHWRKGDLLCRQDEAAEWVAVIEVGRVKAFCHTTGGAEVVLAVRGPGAILGELAAVDGSPRSATVSALEPVTAHVLPSTGFQAFLQDNGRVTLLLMRQLAERLRDADRKRIEFGSQDTTGRVAGRLAELADQFGAPVAGGIQIALPLSQDELAGWVGSSREAVTKALGTLRAAGWIRTSRLCVTVLDIAALRTRSR